MRNSVKLLLGFVSIFPIILSVTLVWLIVYLVFNHPQEFEQFLFSLNPVVGLLINLVLLGGSYGPIMFYIIHAGRNPDLADRKAMWIILLVFVGGLVMPIYWFIFIWRESYYESRPIRLT